MKKQKPRDKYLNQNLSGYEIERRLGSGNFGSVYVARHALHGVVAVKLEVFDTRDPKNRDKKNFLQIEHDFYVNYLNNLDCVPNYISFLPLEDKKLFILAMELFDIDLRHKFEDSFGNKFSIECVSKLYYTMTCIFEQIHSRNILYRDTKPDNFLIKCRPEGSRIVLADFGLSTRYKQKDDMGNWKHVPLRKGLSFVGTTRYASINAHRGLEQSRRDDLESLSFVIGYLMHEKGLPWQGLPAKAGVNRNELVKNEKNAKWSTLFNNEKVDVPLWQKYLVYVHNLDFYTDPDYEFLKCLALNGRDLSDLHYDWDSTANATKSTQFARNSTVDHQHFSIQARPKKDNKMKKALRRFSNLFK